MYESWYQEHYHEMTNAGRWFDGRGINVLGPSLWDARPYRVLIVRLSTARDTAESFTHQLLYQIAASCDGVFADCAWLPPPEDALLFDRDILPWMIGVATKRPALHFDCIAISNSIVQELINLPTILLKSNIPLGKLSRMSQADIPLVLLGGASALNTSALLGEDPPIDAIFAGEDEALIKKIFTTGRQAKLAGKSKAACLEQWTGIAGLIEPDAPKPTHKQSFILSESQQLQCAPVFSGEGDIGAAPLQISEGCPCFCTFCAESWGRKPYREVDSATAMHAALAMKACMGLDRIDLYSFNFNMHAQLKDLITDLVGSFSSIGFKSQRIDGIADDPELMPILHAVGKSSITVGIEGISQRMRVSLQKSLDETKLRAGLSRILAASIRELKLFFLVTGKEKAVDIDEFRELLAFITATMQREYRFPRIIISMTPLVRFPYTPLEGSHAPDASVVREIILQCERLTEAKRFEFRSASSMNEYLFSQIFVRGSDVRLWQALREIAAQTGFVYYRDIPDDFIRALLDRLAGMGLTREALMKAGGTFGRLPIRLPLDDGFIDKVKQSSDGYKDVGYCLGSPDAAGRCLGCEACGDDKQRSRMIAPRPRNNLRGKDLKALVLKSNRSIQVAVACVIAPSQRGVLRSLFAAEMARVFMAEAPQLLRAYRGRAGSLIADRFGSEWIHGEEIFTLLFQEDAGAMLQDLCSDKQFLAKINAALSQRVTVLNISMKMPASLLLTLRIVTPWECDPAKYFALHALKHTALRAGDKGMNYQFTKDALKKRILLSMEIRQDPANSIVEIVPGEKFVYGEFIRAVVTLPSERHLVRVSCESLLNGNHSSIMTMP
jgi:radical SAM superfamily enzyme YgiQ (UPF0313 family)